MTITAQIITDSISPAGIRLTTFQLRYPRFIHAEFMTHRTFSRNASSSRAIPVKKMIEDLRRDPAMPVFWGSNKPGMQAGDELDEVGIQKAKMLWIDAMNRAIWSAEYMIELGLHKQVANRILEPWAHINVVVTATDWENFYTLRRHPDAQPEIKTLADAMWEAQQASIPQLLVRGEWHQPYVTEQDLDPACEHQTDEYGYMEVLNRISVARCARVSYLTHDGRETTVEEDLQLYDRLVGAQPLHASPAEHQATPDNQIGDTKPEIWDSSHLHGNLRGWIQYRKTLVGEFIPG
jgi:thymidylate synthase ThyX